VIKGKNSSKFLALANAELLITEYLEKNQIMKERRTKSVTFGKRMFKEKGNYKNSQEDLFDDANRSVADEKNSFGEGMPHRKDELI
jgi:hypothetical protein